VDDPFAHQQATLPPLTGAARPPAELGLRARLEGGELAGLRRLRLDIGITLVNVELAARRLLEDLDELEMLPPARRERGYTRTRHRRLVVTLHSLARALERPG
jgi:hypothetical protein